MVYTYFNKGCFGNRALVCESHCLVVSQAKHFIVFRISMTKSQSNLYWNRCMSAIEPLVVILAFILLSKFLLTPYEASVEEKLKAVWRTKDKRACTIAFIWMTSGVSQMESKVIANWPSSCEGLQKLLLSSFSFHLQFYWLTKALISERKVKGLAFSQYMMLFFRERTDFERLGWHGIISVWLPGTKTLFQNINWPAKKVILFQSNC